MIMRTQRIFAKLRNNKVPNMTKTSTIILTNTFKPQLNITLTYINLRQIVIIKGNWQMLIIISNGTKPSIARIQTILSYQALCPIDTTTKKRIIDFLTHFQNRKKLEAEEA